MANFDDAILKSEHVVRKTEYEASSRMPQTSKNQCRFGGTFSYISVLDTFRKSRTANFRPKSSETGNREFLISLPIIGLFQQIKHQFICFLAWQSDLWGYLGHQRSRSLRNIKVNVQKW